MGYPDRGAHGRAVTSLGGRIVRGELAPGQLLDIVELERELGVSRTVVRETLRVLAAKGLVDAKPRRGTHVLPRSRWVQLDPDILWWRFDGRADPAFLDELYELRLTFEPTVARLAALRRDDHDLARLHEALGAMRSAPQDDPAAHVEPDVAFHQALLFSAHNELFEQMSTVIEVGLRARDRFVHHTLRSEATEEHAQVLDAVRRRRPHKAELAMRSLLQRSASDVNAAQALRPAPPAEPDQSQEAQPSTA